MIPQFGDAEEYGKEPQALAILLPLSDESG